MPSWFGSGGGSKRKFTIMSTDGLASTTDVRMEALAIISAYVAKRKPSFIPSAGAARHYAATRSWIAVD